MLTDAGEHTVLVVSLNTTTSSTPREPAAAATAGATPTLRR